MWLLDQEITLLCIASVIKASSKLAANEHLLSTAAICQLFYCSATLLSELCGSLIGINKPCISLYSQQLLDTENA